MSLILKSNAKKLPALSFFLYVVSTFSKLLLKNIATPHELEVYELNTHLYTTRAFISLVKWVSCKHDIEKTLVL